MRKSVRLAIGAAGAVPAFGLLAVPADAVAKSPAPTAKKASAHASTHKTVRLFADDHHSTLIPDSSCIASNLNTASNAQRSFHLKFFSKPIDSKHTCIGTIQFSYTGPSPRHSVKAWVENNNGTFCVSTAVGRSISYRCRREFVNGGLVVCGQEGRGTTILGFICAKPAAVLGAVAAWNGKLPQPARHRPEPPA